jgi:glutathione S-transferase
LITQSTPNGQKVQIFLEELAAVYGTEWTTTLMLVKSPVSRANSTNDVVASDISTNEQKKDWFLRLNPNGNGHSFY